MRHPRSKSLAPSSFRVTSLFICLMMVCLAFCTQAYAIQKDGLNEAMMGEKISGGFGDFSIQSKSTFPLSSSEVLWFASFKGLMGAPNARLRAEWITPAGETFKKENFTTKYGNNRFGWAKLDIQGADKAALALEGDWTVNIFWDDELIDTKTFCLGEKRFKQVQAPARLEDHSLTADGYIRLAKIHFSKNEMPKVIDELLKAQNVEPEKPTAYLILGSVYNSLGQPDNAILQFTKAEKLNANAIEVHRGLATAYTKLELFDDAIQEYELAIKAGADSEEDRAKLEALKKKIAKK